MKTVHCALSSPVIMVYRTFAVPSPEFNGPHLFIQLENKHAVIPTGMMHFVTKIVHHCHKKMPYANDEKHCTR